MPELPEVQTVVNDLLEAQIVGLQISLVQIMAPSLIQPWDEATFCQQLQGQTITAINRRAKYIVVTLEDSWCWLIHLRMTGHIFASGPDTPLGAYERGRLTLSDGRSLCYHDTRKFGRFFLTQKPGDILDKLGPEPLEATFTTALLASLLPKPGHNSSSIKAWLLDQSHCAGLGNIYVDEALWEAQILPERPAHSLQTTEIAALHEAIQKVLRKGIRNFGTTLGHTQVNFYSVSGRRGNNAESLNVFRRQGEACPRCGTIIEKKTVAQRGTHFCPKCQH